MVLGRVGVVGLGRSGASAARLLASSGNEVRVTELQDTPTHAAVAAELAKLGVQTRLGSNDPTLADWAGLLVVSPGVPPSNPVIARALATGVPVWSEVELAWRLATMPILAITGTNGKTTTTSLLAAILQSGGNRAVAAGNIGYPLVDAVMDLAPARSLDPPVIVCEVSSFQLAFAPTFAPRLGVVLNVADDHYDWHTGYEDYLQAKAQIAAHQRPGDLLIVNAADGGAVRIAAGAPREHPAGLGAFGPGPLESVGRLGAEVGRTLTAIAGIEGGAVTVSAEAVDGGAPATVVESGKIRLVGPHNRQNVLAASLAAYCWGMGAEAIGRAVAGFSPLPHRATLIATVNEVRYVDDSKATNPHATLSALAGFERVVLIAGGRAKGLDLSPLAGEADRLVGVIAMGEASEELSALFAGRLRFATAGWVEDAVEIAASWAVPGDTVLLSPACASLDQYSGYSERGDRFAAAVTRLQGPSADRPEAGRSERGAVRR
ncbi:MAG TPA: UDP-N-acetylmuramoyl-L-alanine--D-glutamate ligase [Actinomycetota bacterium]|nr:UDP-N-acetylmuramoyl-L-alanine--D-glutamate ligase [Actinomycetota bacterium]